MAIEIAESMQTTQSDETTKATFNEAFFTNEHHIRGSWTANTMVAIVVANGWIPIWIYVNELLKTLLGDDPVITVRSAVYITGTTQLIGSIISMLVVSKLGRRTLLLIGQFTCALSLIALGVTIIKDQQW